MANSAQTYKQKIVLLGDFAVGKTSLINRYVYNIFSEKYIATLGVRVSKKEVTLQQDNGKINVTILLWDINSEDRFQRVLPQYIMGSHGAVIVADVTRPETIENLSNHVEYFRTHAGERNIVISLNKIDLVNESTLNKLKIKVKDNPILSQLDTFFTSAKENENIKSVFTRIATLSIRGPNSV